MSSPETTRGAIPSQIGGGGPPVREAARAGAPPAQRHRPAPTVVIGAGPHGLAATAHLRAAGVQTLCFGEPLELWRRHMPKGMVLRSRPRSSQISGPGGGLTLEEYARQNARQIRDPLRVEEFLDYASWYQERAVPDVDHRKVASVHREGAAGFRVILDDGEAVSAGRVVVAAGVAPFANRPEPFTDLPQERASHAADHNDLSGFAGQRVLVVGAGQSAVESAALLGEAGAQVELLIRGDSIRWLWTEEPQPPEIVPPPLRSTPPTDVGAGLGGWLAATPFLYRRLPPNLRERLTETCVRPAASGWLRPRIEEVRLSFGKRALSAEVSGSEVKVVLDDDSTRTVDHVLLGTGYPIDVRRYPFLPPELQSELAMSGGYPVLARGLESSVPGLHFVGAPAVGSFGPVMRFVVGTHYTAPALAEHVAGRIRIGVRFAF